MTTAASAENPSGTRRLRILLTLGLFIGVCFCFDPALRCDFVSYDDPSYVTRNEHVRTGFSLKNFRWALRTTEMGYWHPMAWLSHMLDVEIHGLEPQGHHLTSILIHGLNTSILFLLLTTATRSILPPLFAALLFGLHPLRVESVVWIAERKDVLSAFFLLLSLAAYGRYATKDERGAYYASLAFFLLGLMSKPMLVTFGLLLFLVDLWPLGRKLPPTASKGETPVLWGLRFIRSSLFFEKIPFLLLAGISSLAAVVGQVRSHNLATLSDVPLADRLLNASRSYALYIGKTVWPDPLAFFYPFEPPGLRSIVAILLLLGLTVAAFRFQKKTPWFTAGWLWYLVSLLPVSGLLQVGHQAMADRYTYIPHMGLLTLAAWSFSRFFSHKHLRYPALLLLSGIVLLAGIRTRKQISVWENSFSLYSHALAVIPDNALAMGNLGAEYFRTGRIDAAEALFRTAIRVDPGAFTAHYNLGLLLADREEFKDATTHLLAAVKSRPFSQRAWLALGGTLAASGSEDAALAAYEAATGHPRGSVYTRLLLGAALRRYGKTERAREVIGQATKGLEDEIGKAAVEALLKRMDEKIPNIEDAAVP